MKALTSNQLSYIAGLFDGEGTILIGRYAVKSQKNLAYRGFMAIANTHVPTLVYIKSLIGGKIVEQGIGKKCFSLTLSANEIRVFLPELIPYLMIKKDQAEIVLRFFEHQASRNFGLISSSDLIFYEQCYEQVKSLKLKRFNYKEETISFGNKECCVCGLSFELTSKSPKRKFCSIYCKKKDRWTRYNPIYYQRRKLKQQLN